MSLEEVLVYLHFHLQGPAPSKDPFRLAQESLLTRDLTGALIIATFSAILANPTV